MIKIRENRTRLFFRLGMKHKSVDAVLYEFKRTRVTPTITKLGEPRNLSHTGFLGGGGDDGEVVKMDV